MLYHSWVSGLICPEEGKYLKLTCKAELMMSLILVELAILLVEQILINHQVLFIVIFGKIRYAERH